MADQYSQFQAQMAMQQAMLQAQQLGQQAAAIKVQSAQAQNQFLQQRNISLMNYQEAIKRQEEAVKLKYQAEQVKQDMLSSQYNVMLNNIQQLNKNLVLDQEMYTNIMYSQAGSMKAEAAGRGVVAGKGSEVDLTNMMIDSVEKTAKNSYRSTLNDINDTANKALALQVEKAFSKWNLDTQINFSNLIIRDEVF